MGNAVWMDYLNRFKFGLPTRFGMGGWIHGGLPGDNYVSQVQSAFGQGISVSQTQMLLCFSDYTSGQMLSLFISATTESQTLLKSKNGSVGKPFQNRQHNDPKLTWLQLNRSRVWNPIQQWANYSGSWSKCCGKIWNRTNCDGSRIFARRNDYIKSVVAMTPAEDP